MYELEKMIEKILKKKEVRYDRSKIYSEKY